LDEKGLERAALLDDDVVAIGGKVSVKADQAGETPRFSFEGYAVRFTPSDSPDLTGEHFTPETDFGYPADELRAGKSFPLYYNHGFNRYLGRKRVGTGIVKMDDVGLFYTAELDSAVQHREMILNLISEDALNYSSGAVSHLVDKTPGPKSVRIDAWPIGEISLTPTAAEPRNFVTLKSLKTSPDPLKPAEEARAASPVDATKSEDVPPTEPVTVAQTKTETMDEKEKYVAAAAVKAAEAKAAADAVDALMAKIDARVEAGISAALEAKGANKSVDSMIDAKTAPAVLKLPAGDDALKAFAHFARTGDAKAYPGINAKASTDSTSNITTAGDGGSGVPVSLANSVVEKAYVSSIMPQVGVQRFTADGNTLEIVTGTATSAFVEKAESAAGDRDAATVGKTTLTARRFSKKQDVTVQLLGDNGVDILRYFENYVAAAYALTLNAEFVTEIIAGGTEALTLNANNAIGAAELPELMYTLPDGYWENASWIMRRATEGYLRGLVGDQFYFPAGTSEAGKPGGGQLLGYPAYTTDQMAAQGADADVLVFGDFSTVAWLEKAGLDVIRDPFSRADNGEVIFHWSFRMDVEALNADAIRYARQPNT
jgi:HK97 family phage major capsid protein